MTLTVISDAFRRELRHIPTGSDLANPGGHEGVRHGRGVVRVELRIRSGSADSKIILRWRCFFHFLEMGAGRTVSQVSTCLNSVSTLFPKKLVHDGSCLFNVRKSIQVLRSVLNVKESYIISTEIKTSIFCQFQVISN